MENAHRIEDTAGAPGTGAAIVAPGALPAKTATVTAEVLARVLAGEKMTGLDAVIEASTTRLSAVVHYLETEYGWCIARADKAAGCRDGRIAWVSEYWLPADTIAIAMAAGAADWCAKVRAARLKLRANAAKARRDAARANAARKSRPPAGQGDFFEGGEVPA